MLDLDTSVAGANLLLITVVWFLTAVLTITTIIFLCACLDKKEKAGNLKGIGDDAGSEMHPQTLSDSSQAGQVLSESVSVGEKTERSICQTSSFAVQSESEYDAIGNIEVLREVKAGDNAQLTQESAENTVGCQNPTSGPLLPPRNSGSHLAALSSGSTAEYAEVGVRKFVNGAPTSSSNAIDDTYEDVDEVKSKAVENQNKWNGGIVPLDDVYEPVGEPKSPNTMRLTTALNSPSPSTVYDSIVIEVDSTESTRRSHLAAGCTSSLIDDHYEPVPGGKPAVDLAARPDGTVPTSTGTVATNATASSPSKTLLGVNPPGDITHLYAKVNKKKKSPSSDEINSTFVFGTSVVTPTVAVSPTSSSGRDGYSTIADVSQTTQRTSTKLDSANGSANKVLLSQNDTGYDSVHFDSNFASSLNARSSGYDSVDDGPDQFSPKDDVYEEMDEVVHRINGANELKVL